MQKEKKERKILLRNAKWTINSPYQGVEHDYHSKEWVSEWVSMNGKDAHPNMRDSKFKFHLHLGGFLYFYNKMRVSFEKMSTIWAASYWSALINNYLESNVS